VSRIQARIAIGLVKKFGVALAEVASAIGLVKKFGVALAEVARQL
jgi:hypothetical protein